MADVSIKYYTGYFSKNNLTVSDNGPQKCCELLFTGSGQIVVINTSVTLFSDSSYDKEIKIYIKG